MPWRRLVYFWHKVWRHVTLILRPTRVRRESQRQNSTTWFSWPEHSYRFSLIPNLNRFGYIWMKCSLLYGTTNLLRRRLKNVLYYPNKAPMETLLPEQVCTSQILTGGYLVHSDWSSASLLVLMLLILYGNRV